MSYELLILNGKPGSGKSTLSKQLAAAHLREYTYRLVMGEHFRDIASGERPSAYRNEITESNHILKSQTGSVGNSTLAARILAEYMEDRAPGLVVLDGYPRYRETLPAFKECVTDMGAVVVANCSLDVPDNVALLRQHNRGLSQPDRELLWQQYRARVAEFHSEVEPTINAMAQFYPTHHLDGELPTEVNVERVARILRK